MPAGTTNAIGAGGIGGRCPRRSKQVLVGDHDHGRDARARASLANRAADGVVGQGGDGEVLDGGTILGNHHSRRVDGLAEETCAHRPGSGAGDHLVEAACVGCGGQCLAQHAIGYWNSGGRYAADGNRALDVSGMVDHIRRRLDVDAAPAEDVVGDLAARHAAAGLGARELHGGFA